MRALWQLAFIFLKIGAFTFGGGYVMLPIIQHELGQKHKLIEEETLDDIIALAQSLPGVLAVNTATLVGYKLHGKKGAAICAFAVVLPSFCIIILLAKLIMMYQDNAYVQGAFQAVRSVVIGMIVAAAVKMSKSCTKSKAQIILLVTAALLAICFNLHPIILIVAGAIVGWVLSRPEEREAKK